MQAPNVSMNLISVNVGMPASVMSGEKSVLTGIFKQPVSGPVAVHKLNLDGDGQADLVHHGGESKAVYAYAVEHYAYWQKVLNRPAMPYGQFGENLTVSGLDEAELCVGDQLAIGDVLLTISQPRVPCFKLGIRLQDERMPKLFAQSLRTGFYLRVIRQGTIAAGDAVRVVARSQYGISIKTLFDAYLKPDQSAARALLKRVLDVPELSPEWQAHVARRLERQTSPSIS